MTQEEYNQKQKNKLERFEELAEKNKNLSNNLDNQARQMASVIPFGQPILVGHYSESRDRNYRKRINSKFEKSIEADEKAKYFAGRAEAIKSNNSIFSDDPSADEKLAEKIERLEQRQEQMKKANSLLRKNDVEGLLNMGFSEKQIHSLQTPDFVGRTGFPSYSITNNGANIRRLKLRLQETIAKRNDETTEKQIGDTKIIDNVEENRLQIFFPSKPSEEVRTQLKGHGFRWSPNSGAWQRHRSNGANYIAEQIVKNISVTIAE